MSGIRNVFFRDDDKISLTQGKKNIFGRFPFLLAVVDLSGLSTPIRGRNALLKLNSLFVSLQPFHDYLRITIRATIMVKRKGK